MGTFRDQVALVTGASAGIGRAITLGLAAEAAALCLVGRTSSTLDAVAETARSTSPHVLGVPADLAVDEAIDDLCRRVEREFGHVDILVHSAGHIRLGRLDGAAAGELDSQYRANVRGPWVLTQALLPSLRARGGQVVFINSSMGVSTRTTAGYFAATQHALKAIADTLRDEINVEGVRVLSVYPGRTASPRQEAIHAWEAKPYRPERLLQPEDVASIVIAALALPRTAEVTEIRIRPFRKS
jgi:NADP-dependent 3-hydroxy acid dehydrogenase YdfG